MEIMYTTTTTNGHDRNHQQQLPLSPPRGSIQGQQHNQSLDPILANSSRPGKHFTNNSMQTSTASLINKQYRSNSSSSTLLSRAVCGQQLSQHTNLGTKDLCLEKISSFNGVGQQIHFLEARKNNQILQVAHAQQSFEQISNLAETQSSSFSTAQISYSKTNLLENTFIYNNFDQNINKIVADNSYLNKMLVPSTLPVTTNSNSTSSYLTNILNSSAKLQLNTNSAADSHKSTFTSPSLTFLTPISRLGQDHNDLKYGEKNHLLQTCVGVNTKAVNILQKQQLNQEKESITLSGQNCNSMKTINSRQVCNKMLQKPDLESFRHFYNYDNDKNIDRETPTNAIQQRSYSVSSEDLRKYPWNISNNIDKNTHNDGSSTEQINDWCRVSQLRRSFQISAKNETNTNLTRSTTTPRRPLDLPENSVSVSKICAELESGKRLSTVMPNNSNDYVALTTILNDEQLNNHNQIKSNNNNGGVKKNILLNADSLKEIREKLKKLSDESLYKEDYILNRQSDVNKTDSKINFSSSSSQSTEENSKILKNINEIRKETFNKNVNGNSWNPYQSKLRETNSNEWYYRRKSYGFEKMSPPNNRAMIRLDSSTDSGLGRSNELSAATPNTNAAINTTTTTRNSTIVHLGEVKQLSLRERLKTRAHILSDGGNESKRHSIAVEQAKYVRPTNDGQSTRILLNGEYDNNESNNSNNNGKTTNQTKRVEFCKTEVHFATESGRVNIVETDTKPPPTQNFRRRRRNSHAGQTETDINKNRIISDKGESTVSSITGNSLSASRILAENNGIWRTHHRTSLERSPEATETIGKVTITTITAPLDTSSRSSGIESTDGEMDDANLALRGILKNKLTKPKPYVLGENNNNIFWPNDNNKTIISNKSSIEQFDTTKNKDVLNHSTLNAIVLSAPKTVAERIRYVEAKQQQLKDSTIETTPETATFSTTIKFNSKSPESKFSSTLNHGMTDHQNFIHHTEQNLILQKQPLKLASKEKPQVLLELVANNSHELKNIELHESLNKLHLDSQTINEDSDYRDSADEEVQSYFNKKYLQNNKDSEIEFEKKNEYHWGNNSKKTNKVQESAIRGLKLNKNDLPVTNVMNIKLLNGCEDEKRTTALIDNYSTKSEALNPCNESLKIIKEARGARQLREHELSYFGIQVNADNNKIGQRRSALVGQQYSNSLRQRSIHNRNHNKIQGSQNTITEIKTSPIKQPEAKLNSLQTNEVISVSITQNNRKVQPKEEHIYENITNDITPIFKIKSALPIRSNYKRSADLERDALILEEMNKTANQTLKEVSEKASAKDKQRNLQLSRRTSKPLETINEKNHLLEQTIHSNKPTKDSKIMRGTVSSEAKRITRQQRLETDLKSSNPERFYRCSRARSQSMSSDQDTDPNAYYHNIEQTNRPRNSAKRSNNGISNNKTGSSRSSSRESQQSLHSRDSSGEDRSQNGFRRDVERMRLRTKRKNANLISNDNNSTRHSKCAICLQNTVTFKGPLLQGECIECKEKSLNVSKTKVYPKQKDKLNLHLQKNKEKSFSHEDLDKRSNQQIQSGQKSTKTTQTNGNGSLNGDNNTNFESNTKRIYRANRHLSRMKTVFMKNSGSSSTNNRSVAISKSASSTKRI